MEATTEQLRQNFQKLTPDQRLLSIQGQRLERSFEFDRATVNEADRTVWMSIASNQPYERWWGVETLQITQQAIRSQRLNSGAPILVDHSTRDQVGVVEQHQISTDGKLRVLARFSKSTRAQEVFQDVKDGIRRSTSVGYMVHKAVLTERGDDNTLDKYDVTDWEPYEGSLVAVPADPTVGPGRALEVPLSRSSGMAGDLSNSTTETGAEGLATKFKQDEGVARADERKKIAKRNGEITALGAQWPDVGGPDLALRAIGDPDMSVDAFRAALLKTLSEKHRPLETGGIEGVQVNGGENRAINYGMAPREVLAATSLNAFKDIGKLMGMKDHEVAYRAGMWAQAVIGGNPRAMQWCRDHGVQLLQGSREALGFNERSMVEGSFTSAGWLVPLEMEAAIISNRELYGVARRICQVIPMSSATTSIPRITGDTTAYFAGEGSSGTASDQPGDQVQLTLKDLMCWTNIGKSTAQDTVIPLAELVAREQARAFGYKEDICLFLGDGSQTYGGMQGITVLLATAAYAGGKYSCLTPINTFAEVDVASVTGLIGILPVYARTGARWVVSGVFDAMVFGRLKLSAGGNTVQTVQGQIIEGDYAGFPVTLSQIMPAGGATDYNAKIMAVLGNFSLGVAFGSGAGMMMTVDPYTLAHQNLTRIITTERIDIVAHGCNKSTTVPGPIVGLMGTT